MSKDVFILSLLQEFTSVLHKFIVLIILTINILICVFFNGSVPPVFIFILIEQLYYRYKLHLLKCTENSNVLTRKNQL